MLMKVRGWFEEECVCVWGGVCGGGGVGGGGGGGGGVCAQHDTCYTMTSLSTLPVKSIFTTSPSITNDILKIHIHLLSSQIKPTINEPVGLFPVVGYRT